jgi:hypothetical protein
MTDDTPLVEVIADPSPVIEVINPSGPPGPVGADGADGQPGPPGTPGALWYDGDGAPGAELGNPGDYYLDDVTGDVYTKSAAGSATSLLASHWKLDEASGVSVVDSVGGKTLTCPNVVTPIATGLSGVGDGIDFLGTNWALSVPPLAQVAADKFSVAGWFKMAALPDAYSQPLFCASWYAGHQDPFYTFALFNDATNSWRVAVDTGGPFAPLDSSVPLASLGAWHHIGLAYDGSNIILYADGGAVYTVAKTGDVGTMGSFSIANIAALNAPANAPNIAASQMSYWNDYALSAADVAALYAARDTDYYGAASAVGNPSPWSKVANIMGPPGAAAP